MAPMPRPGRPGHARIGRDGPYRWRNDGTTCGQGTPYADAMSAERGCIELDERDRRPAVVGGVAGDRLLSARKVSVRLVAAFVVGVVLGGLGVNGLRDSREDRERNSSVALVALPASVSGGGSDVPGVLRLDGQLAVINAGPAPITVRGAAGQGPGVLVRDTGRSRLLRPGGTGWIDVNLRLECASAFGNEPLSMRFSVETGDRHMREVRYPVALRGSVWHFRAEPSCVRLIKMEKRDG